MFPNENAPAWFEKARWPSGLSAPSVARLAKRSTCLGQVLAPQDVQSAVQRHRRYADAPPPPLPMLTWAQATYLIVSPPKGFSVAKPSEMLGRHYQAARHRGHRLHAKLADLRERFGIVPEEMKPALHVADLLVLRGYGDWRNSPSQTIFHCRWCGQAKHADVNAAWNIG